MKVLYVSHADKETGFGVAARRTIRAMESVGVEVVRLDIGGALGPHHLEVDVCVVHAPPWTAIDLTIKLRSFRSMLRIAIYTTWEAVALPDHVQNNLRMADEVWVPSMATSHAFTRGQLPRVLPHAYSSSEASVRNLNKVDPDVYSFSWWGAWTERKNPMGVLRAYALAFEPDDKVLLLMHSTDITQDIAMRSLASIGIAQDRLPPIRWSNARRPLDEIIGDCFVTASRGESWNLPAFEAMAAGAQVISTRDLGSDDFLEDTNARLVRGTLSPVLQDVLTVEGGRAVIQGAQMMDGRCRWIEPDLCTIAADMVTAALSRESLRMDYDLDSRYDYPVVGKNALHLLEQLQG